MAHVSLGRALVRLAIRVSRWFHRLAAAISPAGVITAEIPEFVARTCGSLVSMLRKAAEIRCNRGARSSGNQESFDRVTIKLAFMAAASATNPGNKTS
jgi:hypothetical protein